MEQRETKEAYLVFAAMIDQLAVQKIFFALTTVMQTGHTRAHLLLQSTGGTVQDGICLYNFFRTLPIDLVAYNVGTVASAATTAYLGARTRRSASLATFMIHRAHATFQGANSDHVQARIPSLIMDDDRTEAILKTITLTDEQRTIQQSFDLWLTAKEALAAGIVTEIADFAPPPGTMIYNVFG